MAQTAHITAEDEKTNSRNHKANKRRKEREDLMDYMNNKNSPKYTADIERRRAQIQKEINAATIKPEDMITGESWAKTPEEKKKLKIAKAKHNAFCRANGVDPKKQINVTAADLMKLANLGK